MSSTPSPSASGSVASAHNTPATTASIMTNSSSGITAPGSTTPSNANKTLVNGSTPGSNSNSTRRPPRKSTLTQQQKNQKRQRATQDQLVLLEVEFNKNPTPTAVVRERIASEINMTERSVQIWFQNRRAKIKLLAKKSIETGEDCDAIPESYRNYLAMQAMDSGKPLARTFMNQPMGYGGNMLIGSESQNNHKVVIHHFQCRSLAIGTWRRVAQNAMDLVVFYSLGEQPSLTYYINNESAGFKIEYPFSYIKNITLENQDSDGSDGRMPGLLVELTRPPNFFMDNAGSGGFKQVSDFTEHQQASKVLMHHLGGDPRVLSGQLAKLLLLESFQNRHMPTMDTQVIAASAPVSPIGHRPASQPNANALPHMGMGFADHNFGPGLHPAARMHKRTRSRSVPAITDFSFLSQPMPSFHVQHPSTTITDPSIFAPVPQHAGHLGASNLRINTASTYGIDFRQYPMSAATTNSPSEYASPGFFGPGSDMDGMPSAGFQQSYNLPVMSPMHEHPHGIQQSVSPLSAVSHGDPVIADQSPPLANMHRSASADFLSMHSDHNTFGDDAMFADMYGKNMSLPFRAQGLDDSQFDMNLSEDPTGEAVENHMYSNTIDPSALSADNHGM